MTETTLSRRDALGLLTIGGALAMGQKEASAAAAPAGSGTTSAGRAQGAANWSDALAEYISKSQTAAIPDDIRELARRHILDTLAAIVACRDLQASEVARKFVATYGAGSNAAPILGTRDRGAVLDAILASGMIAHAAEINDFCPSAFTQPGASIIPVTLCLGDMRGTSGESFLRAVLVGYEITCRLPKALGIVNLRNAVLANHSVGPLFGSAAAAASLIRLPREKLIHVFSYCVQQASGSWHWLRDVEHIEKAFVFGGMPGRRGAECALMVEMGFTGIGDPFTGTPGWLNSSMFKGPDSDFNPSYLTEKLGERFEMPLVAYKRYPVGGPTQPAIELLLKLIEEVRPDRIKHIRIEMPGRTDAFANAQMPALNLPYLCSIILTDGKLDFVAAQSRERFLNDTKIHALMRNVEVVHDPNQEAEPRVESARLIVRLDDGSRIERFLDHVKGFPAHPFDREDVEEKALELMSPHLGKEQARKVCDTVWRLESVSNVREIVAMIAR
jgi:2-methylcitrate dehydratase PrpD